MKRDFDLIRLILLEAEQNSAPGKSPYTPEIDGYDFQSINYNIKLMFDAGLVDVYHNTYKPNGDDYLIKSLTYEGHDFLDKIRSESVWNKTKNTIFDKVGSLTFEAIKTVSATIIKGLLE